MEGAPVPADQQGWKDTVAVDDDDWAEFVVRFDYPATERFPYMYHCHILEHEDRGMMGQFTDPAVLSAPVTARIPGRAPASAISLCNYLIINNIYNSEQNAKSAVNAKSAKKVQS